MSLGIVGRKCGMSRLFKESGESVPVTVIEVLPNIVTQIKSKETDGYAAIQVTTGSKKQNKVNKPEAGHFAKAGTAAGRGLWEFRLLEEQLKDFAVGKELKADMFEVGQKVDVAGKSKGKGNAGVVKRYNFSMQRATHGNSKSHRAPGSIGQCQTPGRVFKGKKMAGRLGNTRVTVQTLEVVGVDLEKNLLLIKGGLPGAPGGDLIITPAEKSKVNNAA